MEPESPVFWVASPPVERIESARDARRISSKGIGRIVFKNRAIIKGRICSKENGTIPGKFDMCFLSTKQNASGYYVRFNRGDPVHRKGADPKILIGLCEKQEMSCLFESSEKFRHLWKSSIEQIKAGENVKPFTTGAFVCFQWNNLEKTSEITRLGPNDFLRTKKVENPKLYVKGDFYAVMQLGTPLKSEDRDVSYENLDYQKHHVFVEYDDQQHRVIFFFNGRPLTVCEDVDFTNKAYYLAVLFCGNSECAEYMMDYPLEDRPPMCPMEPKIKVIDFLHDDAVKSRSTNVNSLFQKIEIKKVTGEGLASKDLNGKSDPFVRIGYSSLQGRDDVLSVKEQKAFLETKPNKKSLEFEFRDLGFVEHFFPQKNTVGTYIYNFTHFVVEVWDWDLVGKSDWMGCADFSIDDLFAEVLQEKESHQWSKLYSFITNDVRVNYYSILRLTRKITFTRELGTRLKFKGEKVSGSISLTIAFHLNWDSPTGIIVKRNMQRETEVNEYYRKTRGNG